jgi:hypothetical protein
MVWFCSAYLVLSDASWFPERGRRNVTAQVTSRVMRSIRFAWLTVNVDAYYLSRHLNPWIRIRLPMAETFHSSRVHRRLHEMQAKKHFDLLVSNADVVEYLAYLRIKFINSYIPTWSDDTTKRSHSAFVPTTRFLTRRELSTLQTTRRLHVCPQLAIYPVDNLTRGSAHPALAMQAAHVVHS